MIVELVAFDPALTLQVLRTCNSASLGGAEPVKDLQSAVARLGFKSIYSIVAKEVSRGCLQGAQKGYAFAEGELWRHSAATAVAAATIAAEINSNESLFFTAGLLHDLGKFVLSPVLEKGRVESSTGIGEGISGLEAERRALGVDHAAVGGRLLERWSFSADLIEGVAFHHEPNKAGSHGLVAAGVHLADVIAHSLGYGCGGHRGTVTQASPETIGLLKLDATAVETLMKRARSACEASPLLNLR